MLNDSELTAASDLLVESWRDGRVIPALPDHLRPADRAEGYAIQALLERHSGQPLYGWKIAATSRDGQSHIAVDGPLAGRLLAERAFENGAERPLVANRMRVAEPEFAFRMARDLLPRAAAYSVSEVLAAVGSLHPAIELPDSRYEDFTNAGAAQLIADDACAHEFVLGSASPAAWRDLNLAQHPVTGTVQGKLTRDGNGAQVLGDPGVALAWLVNELSGLGIILKAGQVVTTGTCLQPLPIAPGDQVRAAFGAIGEVTLSVAR